MSYNSNKPAFSGTEEYVKANGYSAVRSHNGLTKREYFAIKILHGLVSGFDQRGKVNERFIPDSDHTELAKQSIQMADELLKQLEG